MSELPITNKILANFSRADYLRLLSQLESVVLTAGQTLHEPGAPIRHVYFPDNALVALMVEVNVRDAMAVGMVGREGMVGVVCALGASTSPMRTIVQTPGTALRMKATLFLKEFRQNAALRREVLLYVHALQSQIAKSAACNCFHQIEERLARWLLMTRDRLASDHFYLTQQFLANMLGVRRVGVTTAAYTLRARKLIDYSRGAIDIIDGAGLQAAACSCYEVLPGRHAKR